MIYYSAVTQSTVPVLNKASWFGVLLLFFQKIPELKHMKDYKKNKQAEITQQTYVIWEYCSHWFHAGGRPTNSPLSLSNPTWKLCWKPSGSLICMISLPKTGVMVTLSCRLRNIFEKRRSTGILLELPYLLQLQFLPAHFQTNKYYTTSWLHSADTSSKKISTQLFTASVYLINDT